MIPPFIKKVAAIRKEGATPLELLVFLLLIPLIVAFGVFWIQNNAAPESQFVARNIAEIRASNPPDVGQELEARFMREVSAQISGCRISPPAEEWYPFLTTEINADPNRSIPVSVEAFCLNHNSSWLSPTVPLTDFIGEQAETGTAISPRPECVLWQC